MQRIMLPLIMLLLAACTENEPTGFIIKQKEPGPESEEIVVGKTLPSWQKGEMDIHFINTTMGECAFIIMPDGTQLLIDAASSRVKTNSNSNTTNTGLRSRWDPTKTSTRGAQIIGAHINKCMVWTGNNKIDYAVLTHFDNDHIGGYDTDLPVSPNSSTYRQNGMAEILDNFTVGKLMDRGYPEYNYPFNMVTLPSNAPCVNNYVTAVKWHVANKGLQAEKFIAGSNTQIVPKTSDYDVTIQNIAVNGEIWTGTGTATKKTFPELKDIDYVDPTNITSADNCPFENICSCVMDISFGDFNYFAGGDLQYTGKSTYSWKDTELPCATVVGPVDVMKADHHGVTNTNSTDAIKALKPSIWVVNSWVDCHPRTPILENVETQLPNCDIYITNFWKGERPAGVDTKVTDAQAARVLGYDGDVIIRVYDGGKTYRVIILDDVAGDFKVKYVSKVYYSK